MMLDVADKSFFTNRLVVTAAVSTLVGGSLLFAGIAHVISRANAAFGDTPVILVGGSLTFKAGANGIPWKSTSATQYYVTPAAPIATIAIKADYTKADENDPTTDKMSVGVSSGGSWEVDEFAIDDRDQTSAPIKVASITPQGANITLTLLDAGGFLCSDGNNSLNYDRKPLCPDYKHFKFSQANLTASAADGSQMSGTLICIDANAKAGKCKVAFRGPLH